MLRLYHQVVTTTVVLKGNDNDCALLENTSMSNSMLFIAVWISCGREV
jgi:hypothetical protein